jgi:hypothetical protein
MKIGFSFIAEENSSPILFLISKIFSSLIYLLRPKNSSIEDACQSNFEKKL